MVNSSEGLLVRAQPLGVPEEISRRTVEVRVVDGSLLLDTSSRGPSPKISRTKAVCCGVAR